MIRIKCSFSIRQVFNQDKKNHRKVLKMITVISSQKMFHKYYNVRKSITDNSIDTHENIFHKRLKTSLVGDLVHDKSSE